MISFPCAKLNIGLRVGEKRRDGYHDIESILYPIPCWDALEVIPSSSSQLSCSGLPLSDKTEDNLVWLAYKLLAADHKLPPLHVHLHKCTPVGAGLGGGSSDTAEMLLLLNRYFELKLSRSALLSYAERLGCDVPFFLRKEPQIAKSRGELLQPLPHFLDGTYVQLLVPPIHVHTTEAYKALEPQTAEQSPLSEILSLPWPQWQEYIKNDFQSWLFALHPEVSTLAQGLQAAGAWYVSLSGTGSAVYGLFETAPSLNSPEGVWSKSFLLENSCQPQH